MVKNLKRYKKQVDREQGKSESVKYPLVNSYTFLRTCTHTHTHKHTHTQNTYTCTHALIHDGTNGTLHLSNEMSLLWIQSPEESTK